MRLLSSRRAPVLLWLAASLWGCIGGQTGSEGRNAYVQPPGAGRGGSVGCATDADCMLHLEDALNWLRRPGSVAPDARVIGAECMAAPGCSNLRDNHCLCVFGSDGASSGQALLLGARSGCHLYGRSLACLLPEAELASCDPADGCACAEPCDRALGLIQADQTAAPDVEAREASCSQGSCRFVVRVQDRCYAGDLPSATTASYDCALSNDELLELADSAAATPGAERGALAQISGCGVGGSPAVADYADSGVAACLQQ